MSSLAFAAGAVWLSSAACTPSVAGAPPADASNTAKSGASPATAELSVAHGSALEHAENGPSYLLPEASVGRLQSPINIVTSRVVPAQHEV